MTTQTTEELKLGGLRPSDIEIANAKRIVNEMLTWRYTEIGLCEGDPPDLSRYSLRELLDANDMVRDFGETVHEDGRSSIPMKCADRLIAALYAATHFPAYPQDAIESIVVGRGKALLCVVVPS